MAGTSLVAVNKIELEKDKLSCYKAVYSNHMQGKFMLHKKPYCISIAKGCVDSKPIPKSTQRLISELDMTDIKKDKFIKEYQFKKEEAVTGLEHRQFILAAGRGVRTKDKVERLEKIAKEIGAELGVSRPIAMNGWTPLNQLIGVSGAMTKPDLCIAVGVSGAAAFFAGIEKSKYIIGINSDKRAAIIKASDVAIIDDYEKILEELYEIIKEHNETAP